MVKLIDILVENPDTVYYKKKTYNYNTPANKCAFFIYKDKKTKKETTFGYSLIKKEFYCTDPDVLKEVNELANAPKIKMGSAADDNNQYWAQRGIEDIKNRNNGGGHLALENILSGLGRWVADDDLTLKGRIFEVDDTVDTSPKPGSPNLDIQIESTIPSGKAIIVTFWSYNRDNVAPWKDQIDHVVEFNNFKPEECLYELGSKVMTFSELYGGKEEPKMEPTPSTPKPQSNDSEATKYFKVGDRVKLKGMKIYGDVVSMDGNNITIKITDTDMPTVAPKDVEKTISYVFLEPDNTPAGLSLEKVIDDKTQEFVEKRGKLHTTGAKFTPAEKANLEKEVDSLEIELKMLNNYLTNGLKIYTDELKNLVNRSVQRKLHDKEKEKLDRYSLAAQAEKQYDMPIAQIRQKYRGVPLDQLVKKEHLIREIVRKYVTKRK